MSWGNPFKSAWNTATDIARTAAKAVVNGVKTVAKGAKKLIVAGAKKIHSVFKKIKFFFTKQIVGRYKQVCKWLNEDDVARKKINDLTLAEIRALSAAERQELKNKLSSGWKSKEDKEALAKIWRAENEASINQALADQKNMLNAKKAELARWNNADKAKFNKWFGTTSEEDRRKMQDRIDKMLELNNNTSINNFYPPETSKEKRYAYVYPNDSEHKIYLDKAFHRASQTGKDSKAGTLAHEMSHFSDIGGTDDHVYGESKTKKLAEQDSDDALDNADNFEYYVENVN